MVDYVYKYRQADLDFIRSNSIAIIQISSELGIKPEALAGGVIRELSGTAQNNTGVQAIKSYIAAKVMAQGLANLDTNEKVADFYFKAFADPTGLDGTGDQSETLTSKNNNPTLWDVGPGKIKIHTAIDMLDSYLVAHPGAAADPASDPLQLKKYDGHLQDLVRDLQDANNPLTFKIAGLVAKAGADFFSEKIGAAGWAAIDPDTQAALTTQYYVRGDHTMELDWQKAADAGSPWPNAMGFGSTMYSLEDNPINLYNAIHNRTDVPFDNGDYIRHGNLGAPGGVDYEVKDITKLTAADLQGDAGLQLAYTEANALLQGLPAGYQVGFNISETSSGSLLGATLHLVSADGHISKTYFDGNHDGHADRAEFLVTLLDGSKTQEVQLLKNGALTYDEYRSLSANGLNSTASIDLNGDGIVDQVQSAHSDGVGLAGWSDDLSINSDGSRFNDHLDWSTGNILADEILTTKTAGGAVVKTVDTFSNGAVTASDQTITLPGKTATTPTTTLTTAAIGEVFGSSIGQALGGKNPFVKVAAGSALSAIGGTLGKTIDLYFDDRNPVSFEGALGTALNGFGSSLGTALLGQATGAVSGFLIAELDKLLGINTTTFGGQLVNVAGSTVLNKVLSNIATQVTSTGHVTDVFAGFNGTIVDNLSGAIGGFLGSYLAHQVLQAESVAGVIGGNLGGSLGGLVASSLIVGNSVTTAAAGLLTATTLVEAISVIADIIAGLIVDEVRVAIVAQNRRAVLCAANDNEPEVRAMESAMNHSIWKDAA
jgi:hypothetical protein